MDTCCTAALGAARLRFTRAEATARTGSWSEAAMHDCMAGLVAVVK